MIHTLNVSMRVVSVKGMVKRFYGWRPQLKDMRDIKFGSTAWSISALPVLLPPRVDLRSQCPPVYDQMNCGSCTANAIIAAYEFDLIKQSAETPMLSRLFLYYNERLMEGTTDYDAGAMIRDGIKSITKLGCCKENLWPYEIEKFRTRPSDEAYLEAQNHQAILYASVEENLFGIKLALAEGYPVIFGFTVYDSFESEEVTRTGIMPMPEKTEKVQGGHAVLVVGYNTDKRQLICRNSWSAEWGDKGYFYMPFDYIGHLCRDFWVLKQVE